MIVQVIGKPLEEKASSCPQNIYLSTGTKIDTKL